jgi:hypothetical protein
MCARDEPREIHQLNNDILIMNERNQNSLGERRPAEEEEGKKIVNNGFSLWKNLHNELMKEPQTISFVHRFRWGEEIKLLIIPMWRLRLCPLSSVIYCDESDL